MPINRNELASTYLLPVIDAGVRVGATADGPLRGLTVRPRLLTADAMPVIDAGVRVGATADGPLRPDRTASAPHRRRPCLWCRGSISADAIRVEKLPTEHREQLVREGYVAGGFDLVARLEIDVAADESVRTVMDAAAVVREQTATVVNVWMSKLGGPTAALQAAQAAAAGGLGVMLEG